MELNPDNQDEMDSRPLGREAGVKVPEAIATRLGKAGGLKVSRKPSKFSPGKIAAE